MPIAVEMPKMTDTMEEGVLVQWNVDEGAEIAAGDVIAQVETDKATMDVEAYDDGVLLRKVAGEGDALPIGALIAVLGARGDDVDAFLSQQADHKPPPVATEKPPASPQVSTPQKDALAPAAAGADRAVRIKASPLARRVAADHGLPLYQLRGSGSGPDGRIIRRDVEAHLSHPAAAVTQPDGYESVRVSQMRKTIARRLSQSKFTAPHFYLSIDVDMEQAVASRQRLNSQAERTGGVKVSYNDLVTKACAAALVQHPAVNSSYVAEENEIRQYNYVDIGIAVAIEDGLVTPVVRGVDRKGLTDIASETAALAQRARDRKLQPAEMEGSTFTTSNLGMFGIEDFTAIINTPNACILAIGAIRDVPVVKGGQVVPGKRMKITLSCDHRAVDGALGARFMATLRGFLEEPLTLLM